MTGVITLRTLRSSRRGLVGWGLGTVLLVVLMGLFWPSIRDIPDVQTLLSNYPEAMRKLFDIEAMTTGPGYLNAELFSMMLPALFVIFAIGRGARLLAGEEENGLLEAVLVTPASRRRILVEKALALAASLAVLGAVLFAATVVTSAAFTMHAGIGQTAAASTSMVLLGVEYGWLALAVGAATGRRAAAIGAGAVAAVAGYVLYVLGRIVDAVSPWAVLSPVHQAIAGGPIGGGWPALFLAMPAGALALLAFAVLAFDRRDART